MENLKTYNQIANAFIKSRLVQVPGGNTDGKLAEHKHKVDTVEFLIDTGNQTYKRFGLTVSELESVMFQIKNMENEIIFTEIEPDLPF